jgi:hypothetical protein
MDYKLVFYLFQVSILVLALQFQFLLVGKFLSGVVEYLNYLGEVINTKNVSIGKNPNFIKVKFTGKNIFEN